MKTRQITIEDVEDHIIKVEDIDIESNDNNIHTTP